MNGFDLQAYCKTQVQRWYSCITRNQYSKATEVCSEIIKEAKKNSNGMRDMEKNYPGLLIGEIFKGLRRFTEVYKLTRNKNWYRIPNIVEKSWDLYISSMYALNDTTFFSNKSLSPISQFVLDFYRYFEKTIRDEYGQGMYLSPTLIIKDLRCSICGSDFRRCPHERLKIYDGKVCKPVIHEFIPGESSIVDSPRDRRCRIWPWNTDEETRTIKAKLLVASDEE